MSDGFSVLWVPRKVAWIAGCGSWVARQGMSMSEVEDLAARHLPVWDQTDPVARRALDRATPSTSHRWWPPRGAGDAVLGGSRPTAWICGGDGHD
jgi:hypothetical protein